jgi:type I restriction enzyme, S subunit
VKAGWDIKPLGKLCEFQRGLTYSKTDEVADSENIVLRANNVDLETNTLDLSDLRCIADNVHVPEGKKVRQGSLLICTASGSKSHLGKVAFVDDDYGYAFGGFMGQITPNADVDGRFLFHVMTSAAYKDFIAQLSDGANINNLKFNDLQNFQVAVPSIEEQHRIVTLLDEAFTDIATAKANAEKNLQNARALCEGLMQSLFPEDGNVAADAPALDTLCELIVDCEHKTAPTQENGIPSIRTPNIGKGRLLLDGVYRVSDETYTEWTRRAEPQGGDLILAREAPAGNVAVIPDGMKVCLGQRTVLIRPKKSVFEPAYLAQLLLRQNSQRRLLAHSRGATVQHINMKDIRAFKIGAIPTPADQQRIVSQVNELFNTEDRLVSIYRQKLTALDDLKKSLLHQAFSGQL